ncbi:MAG: putative transporter small subunit [Candidatus Oceanisphaera merdipullorum]|nr:putative transporter small subunit [Candidatus Oceanisphaera merdipullorum]
MNEFTLGAYILVWPVLTLWVLVALCRGVLKDLRQAKQENRDLV